MITDSAEFYRKCRNSTSESCVSHEQIFNEMEGLQPIYSWYGCWYSKARGTGYRQAQNTQNLAMYECKFVVLIKHYARVVQVYPHNTPTQNVTKITTLNEKVTGHALHLTLSCVTADGPWQEKAAISELLQLLFKVLIKPIKKQLDAAYKPGDTLVFLPHEVSCDTSLSMAINFKNRLI